MTKQSTSELMTTRRGAVALLGSALTTGCLRLSESSGPGSEYFSTRSDALEYASSFAIDETYSLDHPGNPPEVIQHDTVYSGASGSSGPNGSSFNSNDIIVRPIEDPIEIGGSTDRHIKVQDLVTDSQAVFQPDSSSGSILIDRFLIEIQGEGGLESQTPRFSVSQGDFAELEGSWDIEDQLFEQNIFGRYVVELREKETVIGVTGADTIAIGYQWGMEQTAEAVFITRHPMVDEAWTIEFSLDDVDQTVEGTHRPDEDVFEIDLTQFDTASNLYSWELTAYDDDGPEGVEQTKFRLYADGTDNGVFID